MRAPVWLLAGLALLLLRDGTGAARCGLAACALHEGGHLAVFCCCKRRLPQLAFSLRGVALDIRQESLSQGQLLALAAAGPLCNLVVCSATLLWMQCHASYLGYYFACANLCVGVFNLLPVADLDGRRLWQLLRDGVAGA